MRIVVTGATGNVGTSVVRALAADPAVEQIIGIARRLPRWTPPRTRWERADVVTSPLEPLFAGADAVIHLAWLIQPSRDAAKLKAVNVDGSRRVFEAAARAGVPRLVHASSVGVYSPGPSDSYRRVDESWPRAGVQTSFYARHKAEAERLLDGLEDELRIVRLRPALIFKREAGAEIRRLFIGPLLPSRLVRPELIPLLPLPAGLVMQAVHSLDVGEAYRLAATAPEASGAYNVAAEPVLDARELGRLLGARPVAVPPRLLRVAAAATWRARLQPTPPGWLDMGLGVPLMDSRRAREQLGWAPRSDAGQALHELLDGIRRSAGMDTPPLAPDAGGRLRLRELAQGVGARS
jgi:UDP-glucose 4-epimerase